MPASQTAVVPAVGSATNSMENTATVIIDSDTEEAGPRSRAKNKVHGDLIFARWLYSLNLAIDANFRLKNKARGIKNDLPLGDSWGHWVPEVPYQQYLSKYGHQIEVRAIPICTSHSC